MQSRRNITPHFTPSEPCLPFCKASPGWQTIAQHQVSDNTNSDNTYDAFRSMSCLPTTFNKLFFAATLHDEGFERARLEEQELHARFQLQMLAQLHERVGGSINELRLFFQCPPDTCNFSRNIFTSFIEDLKEQDSSSFFSQDHVLLTYEASQNGVSASRCHATICESKCDCVGADKQKQSNISFEDILSICSDLNSVVRDQQEELAHLEKENQRLMNEALFQLKSFVDPESVGLINQLSQQLRRCEDGALHALKSVTSLRIDFQNEHFYQLSPAKVVTVSEICEKVCSICTRLHKDVLAAQQMLLTFQRTIPAVLSL